MLTKNYSLNGPISQKHIKAKPSYLTKKKEERETRGLGRDGGGGGHCCVLFSFTIRLHIYCCAHIRVVLRGYFLR